MPRIRTGGYRKTFFVDEELKELLPQVWPRIQAGRKLWESSSWSGAEWVDDVFLTVWQAARPKAWSNGQRNGIARLRGIPDSALQTIKDWQGHRINLELVLHIPKPDEVLEAQCIGQRFVSLLINSESEFVVGCDGRDGFSFLLHDLIHASHFYRNKEHFLKQVFFCRWMQQLRRHPEAGVLDRCQASFEYLISDMNTHVVHSIKCLKSILPDGLASLGPASFSDLVGGDAKALEFSEIWERLNTPRENENLLAALNRLIEMILPTILADLELPPLFSESTQLGHLANS